MERHFLVNRHKDLIQRGFTLIELLIVVAIIITLSSLPTISHNTIKGSEVGIGCEDSSFPIIQYNRFSANSVDILTQDISNPARVGNIFSYKTEAD